MTTIPSGIIWIGPVFQMGGYGNVSRSYLKCLSKLGLPIQVINIADIHHEIGQDEINFVNRISQPHQNIGKNPILIIHTLPEYYEYLRNHYCKGFKNIYKKIGITIFETDRIPQHWVAACNRMDEIWVPSAFNIRTFHKSGVDRNKLKLVPYAIDLGPLLKSHKPYQFDEETKGFKFLYATIFDFRKGFDLLIDSYCQEFTYDDDVSLVLKIYAPQFKIDIDPLTYLHSLIPQKEKKPHMLIILNTISDEDLYSLYQSCDCFISPDRGNGWGMPAMEMMAMGKPAIAINWCGATQFMNESNSFLIEPEKELEDVHPLLAKNRPALYAGHKWAAVKPENVRKVMREAYTNKEKREYIANKAKDDIISKYSLDSIAQHLRSTIGLNSVLTDKNRYELETVHLDFNNTIGVNSLGFYSHITYSDTFSYGDKKLHYNRVPINNASERAIEVPIGLNFLLEHKAKRVLEVGNVLQQYIQQPIYGTWDILDKFEVFPGVINVDLMEYNPTKKYDAIVSISTVEHIGQRKDPSGSYGEEDIDRDKEAPLKAIVQIYNLLKEDGYALITVPFGKLIDHGWLIHFDEHYMELLVDKYKMPADQLNIKYYKKMDMEITWDNPLQKWAPCGKENLVDTIYNYPFPNANGIAVLEIIKNSNKELKEETINNTELKFHSPEIINNLYFNYINRFIIPSGYDLDGWIPIHDQGVVFYGPYIELDSGWYTLDLQLETSTNFNFTIDLASKMGKKIIMTHTANDSLELLYRFHLPVPESKFEIRLINNTVFPRGKVNFPEVRVKKIILTKV